MAFPQQLAYIRQLFSDTVSNLEVLLPKAELDIFGEVDTVSSIPHRVAAVAAACGWKQTPAGGLPPTAPASQSEPESPTPPMPGSPGRHLPPCQHNPPTIPTPDRGPIVSRRRVGEGPAVTTAAAADDESVPAEWLAVAMSLRQQPDFSAETNPFALLHRPGDGSTVSQMLAGNGCVCWLLQQFWARGVSFFKLIPVATWHARPEPRLGRASTT